MNTSLFASAAVVISFFIIASDLSHAQTKPAKKKSQTVAQPQKIAPTELPAEVKRAFEEAYPNATLLNSVSFVRDGATFFKLSTLDGSKSRELLYAADGALLEFIESISALELPEAIKVVLHEEHPNTSIVSARRIVSAAPTLYEVTLKVGEEQKTTVYDTKGNVVRKVDTLPSAVQQAFRTTYPNAEILAFRKYDRDGFARWVVESKDGKVFREVIYAENGSEIKITESLSPLDLPEAIKETLADNFTGSTIERVKRTTSIEYHVDIADSLGKSELALDASGMLLDLHSDAENAQPNLAEHTSETEVSLAAASKVDATTPIRVKLPESSIDSTVIAAPLPEKAKVDSEKKEKRTIIIRRYYAPSLAWVPPLVRIWRPRWFWW